MRYYFVSFAANTKAGNMAYGNMFMMGFRPLSLAQMKDFVEKKLNIREAVILNFKFLTEKQYKELKGWESDGED